MARNTSLRILKTLLHFLTVFFLLLYCGHVSTVLLRSLLPVWFSHWVCNLFSPFSLKAFKIFSFSQIFCNVTPKLQSGSPAFCCAEFSMGLLNIETDVLQFCEIFLSYIFVDFLPSISPSLDFLWLGCWVSSTDTLIFLYFLSFFSTSWEFSSTLSSKS